MSTAFHKNWGIAFQCSTEFTICSTRKAYFNGFVQLPQLDYADVVWGDQPGLTTQLKQMQSFQNRIAKKISKGKMTSAEALITLQWVPLHEKRFLVQDAMKGEIPEHFDVFKSTTSQQHGYNTRNGYMPVIGKPRTEWGKIQTYNKALTDWASLPTELKKLMPKRMFKYKLKQFLLDHF